ncbi:hypothetical protein BDY19DRAFT_329722 [Irpex rosettiformis]|uniref:Uncharacterized protein n=1 Tax=Irpex rosettiformis TaxID=378272 RepID=A0ACB8TXQ3_9APHY|nr:hypothetical protein BDY19DRAFT_329722 [Irpex rosettiformis]
MDPLRLDRRIGIGYIRRQPVGNRQQVPTAMGFLTPTVASRKYVDLLKETSAKWANWDPPKRIRAGDFGTINRKTGEFNCEGNIYNNSQTKTIADQYPKQELAAENSFIIRSYRAKERKNAVGAEASLSSLASALLSVEVHFSKERGAFLIMHNVYMTVVPDELLAALKGNPSIKGKEVVTQTFTCNGYAQYISNGDY